MLIPQSITHLLYSIPWLCLPMCTSLDIQVCICLVSYLSLYGSTLALASGNWYICGCLLKTVIALIVQATMTLVASFIAIAGQAMVSHGTVGLDLLVSEHHRSKSEYRRNRLSRHVHLHSGESFI